MIIDKQNVLEAGACQEGADEGAIICKFPCEYDLAIARCKDANKNEFAAWLVLFKGQIIETTPNFTKKLYRLKNLLDNEWIEVSTEEELISLSINVKENYLKEKKQLFPVNKEIKMGELTKWELVDIELETQNATYDVFNCINGENVVFTSLEETKTYRKKIQEEYFVKTPVDMQVLVESADKTQSAWLSLR